MMLYFVVGFVEMESLSTKASMCIEDAFRPKTKRAYMRMFRVFVVFCIIMKVALSDISVKVIVSLLECLVINGCSVSMLANYVSAVKAKFVVYDLDFHACEHPKVKYFIKSVRINRPLSVVYHNIIDNPMLKRMAAIAATLPGGQVLKAIVPTGFFASSDCLTFVLIRLLLLTSQDILLVRIFSPSRL